MVNEITKGSEVTEARKREEDQRIHTHNSWMAKIFMLMYFLFSYVTGNLNCLCADEEKPIDKLSTGKKEEEIVYSKSEHMLEEPKDLLQIQCWKTWLKGLFNMRTLPRFISWVSAAILQKKQQERSSWT